MATLGFGARWHFQRVGDGASLGSDAFADLHALWHSRRRPDGLPARRDFSLQELRPWLTSVFLVDTSPDPAPPRFVVAGDQMCQAFGCELTGREIADPVLGPFGMALGEELRRVRSNLQPLMSWAIPSLTERPYHPYECLFLPLADDGTTVDRMLGAFRRAVPE